MTEALVLVDKAGEGIDDADVQSDAEVVAVLRHPEGDRRPDLHGRRWHRDRRQYRR